MEKKFSRRFPMFSWLRTHSDCLSVSTAKAGGGASGFSNDMDSEQNRNLLPLWTFQIPVGDCIQSGV